MEYRLMGNTGVSVSRLCLGSMNFGHETDQDGAFEQLDAYLDAGGNFIDTADVYSDGAAETIIGNWFKERPGMRQQVVLATKGRFPTGEHPNSVGLSRKHLNDALNASLRRLGVETIDLYQMHAFDPLTPLEETLRFVDDAIRAGKVHYFGISNFIGYQIAAVSERALSAGLTPPAMLQPQYNLLVRGIEAEVVPACLEYGMGIIAWSPLGGGWLSGKYHRDVPPTGHTRLGENPERGMEGWAKRNANQQTWDILAELRRVADELGVTMAQAALAWVADRPAVTAPILGARTMEQLQDVLGAADLHLPDELIARLDDVSDPRFADYPYGKPGRDQRDRPIPGGRAN